MILILVAVEAPSLADSPRLKLDGPARAGEIESLIELLAHVSYEKRTFATRRLCAIGMESAAALQKASRSRNVERALRAAFILDALEKVMFAGVTVELELSRSEVSWNEPVDLTVVLTNRSDYPARVPFELAPSDRARIDGDARQVADLIDVAEWLNITNDAGDSLPLHVDDINVDPAISRVVHERVEDAPSSVLAPGQQARLVAREINRGWARYRLLDRGRYRFVMRYVPPWEDTVLAAAEAGMVVSDTAELNVTGAAPASVSRRGAEASIRLSVEGSDYVVRLTNLHDHPTFINRNFGPTTPFAQGRWVGERGASMRDIAVIPHPMMDWSDFTGDLLTAVPPGASVELTRIDRKELGDRFEMLGLDTGQADVVLYFSYTNLCDRHWQAKQERTAVVAPAVPGVLREPLPRRLLTGWHTSDRVRPNQTITDDDRE